MTAPLRPGLPRAARRPAPGGRGPGGLARPSQVPGLLLARAPFHLLALVGLLLAAPRTLAAGPGALLAEAASPQSPASPPPPGPVYSPGRDSSWSFDPATPFYSIGPAPLAPPGLGLPSAPGGLLPARPGPTPWAITAPRPQIPPCPLIVPAKDFALQPLHIPPSQVRFKNSLGCLSAADAIYGPDGCPRRLCGSDRGVRLPLPPGGP